MMLKVMQGLWVVVAVLGLVSAVDAGVWLEVATHVNSLGQDVYIVSANSDGAPISSLGIHVEGDGNLGQVHPFGGSIATHRQDGNVTFAAVPADVDWDTQAMFHSINDSLIMSGFYDSTDSYSTNFTGFAPFYSRDIMQIVLTGGEATAIFGMVAGGVETTLMAPYTRGTVSVLNLPEPASLGVLAVSCAVVMRRR